MSLLCRCLRMGVDVMVVFRWMLWFFVVVCCC